MLARELASIDQLSEGRLEVGPGAGYQVNDYAGSGIAMDPPAVRVDRLIEYVTVLRGLFAEGPFDFAGEHYPGDRARRIAGAVLPRRTTDLRRRWGAADAPLAAAHADIVGVNPSLPSSDVAATSAQDALPLRIDTKFTWIREAAGRRLEELEFHAWVRWAQVTSDAHTAVQPLTARFGAGSDHVLASPIVLVGSVPEIIDRLHARRERWGYSYVTVQQPVAREFAPVLAALAV